MNDRLKLLEAKISIYQGKIIDVVRDFSYEKAKDCPSIATLKHLENQFFHTQSRLIDLVEEHMAVEHMSKQSA